MSSTGKIYDVVIIGGGPAGMSAAIWSADLGLDALLVDGGRELGGNLLNIYNPITNFPGLTTGNGREMRDAFEQQSRNTGIPMQMQCSVKRVDPARTAVELTDGSTLQTSFVILATGVRRRKLGIPGEEQFAGRGILDSGSKSRDTLHDKVVVIVGGGDAALENAAILAPVAKQVLLVHRGARFTARNDIFRAASEQPNVQIFKEHEMIAVNGQDVLKDVEIRDIATGKKKRFDVDNVIFRIGVEPNSELVRSTAETDARGYVVINSRCETSLPILFAIGDVASPAAPTISSAIGQAATAVKVIRSRLR
ncbi:MAG: NAD(P)/FAD-dependent oxidoreductase [Acidobacteriota bacterium]